MIKSIATITEFAVFDNFNWDSAVRDEAKNRPAYFKRLNIIYGRNYSGKTVLSRIVRALETREAPKTDTNPTFTVEFADGARVCQDSLTPCPHPVRVFNEYFVRQHLRVFFNPDEDITSFAVGAENVQSEELLAEKERALGDANTPGSLLAIEGERRTDWSTARDAHKGASDARDDQLREKANDPGRGIKFNTLYGDPLYDIRKIKADIKEVRGKGYTLLTDMQPDELKALLRETPKPDIAECAPLVLKYETIAEKARSLVEREVTPTVAISELLDDPSLQEWVKAGIEHHKGKRDRCGFCQGLLPDDLWERLDKHFTEESETLREGIASLKREIDTEEARVPDLMPVDNDAFYGTYAQQAKLLKEKINHAIRAYKVTLADTRRTLDRRLGDIFTPINLPETTDISPKLEALRTEYEDLRGQSNAYTASLKQKQEEARNSLRLDEIADFISTIQYEKQDTKIKALKKDAVDNQAALELVTEKVAATRKEIAALKTQMTDEKVAADRINYYLGHHFGHRFLSLHTLESEDGEQTQYRFEIRRDGKRADHLSEGERDLVAFCYFMAKLEDVDTSGTKPIIWIDDPVSSLDDNHVFFVHSLIKSRIVEAGAFAQLIISTHSLAFLKYLMQLPRNREEMEKNTQHFTIRRTGLTSTIQLMPKYLREYVTEFHYLFHQIFLCADLENAGEPSVDVYYNLGNNIRRFLEIYLCFLYPDPAVSYLKKLRQFFEDDDIAVRLIERLYHERSHHRGLFERGKEPVDVPEMKQAATYLLTRMKERDGPQYHSLLASIGESAADSGQEQTGTTGSQE